MCSGDSDQHPARTSGNCTSTGARKGSQNLWRLLRLRSFWQAAVTCAAVSTFFFAHMAATEGGAAGSRTLVAKGLASSSSSSRMTRRLGPLLPPGPVTAVQCEDARYSATTSIGSAW